MEKGRSTSAKDFKITTGNDDDEENRILANKNEIWHLNVKEIREVKYKIFTERENASTYM
jgi:hypothetical protein